MPQQQKEHPANEGVSFLRRLIDGAVGELGGGGRKGGGFCFCWGFLSDGTNQVLV